MKFVASLLFLALSLHSPALAEDCLVDLRDVSPLVDKTSALIKTIKPVLRDKERNMIVQLMELKDGTLVEAAIGGCTHYGFTLIFANVDGIAPGADKASTFRIVRDKVLALPVNKDNAFAEFSQRLRVASGWTADGGLVCGEATCPVELSDRAFSIGYHTAM